MKIVVDLTREEVRKACYLVDAKANFKTGRDEINVAMQRLIREVIDQHEPVFPEEKP